MSEYAHFVIDKGGKVVVSLGGRRCSLGCRHCYIFAPSFRLFPARSPGELVVALREAVGDNQLSAIYLSGDTDPFLHEKQATAALRAICDEFNADVLFSTRLLLSDQTMAHLESFSRTQRDKGHLFIATVSIPAFRAYDRIEIRGKVPSPAQRLNQLGAMLDLGLPTMMAIRPIFPADLVPPEDYELLIESGKECSTVILGEVLFVDLSGKIEKRLGHAFGEDGNVSLRPMDFLDQSGLWRVVRDSSQERRMRALCQKLNKPFYMRSMPAVELLRRYWDPDARRLVLANCYPLPVPDFE